jgi:hypothetical protein
MLPATAACPILLVSAWQTELKERFLLVKTKGNADVCHEDHFTCWSWCWHLRSISRRSMVSFWSAHFIWWSWTSTSIAFIKTYWKVCFVTANLLLDKGKNNYTKLFLWKKINTTKLMCNACMFLKRLCSCLSVQANWVLLISYVNAHHTVLDFSRVTNTVLN